MFATIVHLGDRRAIRLLVLVLTWQFAGSVRADAYPADLAPLIQSSCIHCHDSGTKTRLNLESLNDDLGDPNTFRQWERIYDRVAEGEMPQVDAPPPTDIHDNTDLVGRIRLLLNLVPLIIQTDSSRIVSVVIQDHQVVPQVAGVELEHHNLSHHGRDETKIVQLKNIERAILECYCDLLSQMKTKQEAGQTLLENTAVLFGSNLGNANAHDPRNLPIFLAGGGYQHGCYVAYDKTNNTPLSNLFVSLLNRMGIETDSFATSTGELSI